MARKIGVEIVGNATSVERAFQKSSRAARSFGRSTNLVEHDFSRMTRGVLSGSGVFTHLGRSLAFASGGFLAFGSAAAAVRSSVDAAETSEKALRALAAQAKASRQNVNAVFSDVGKLQAPALQLGFNKADVEQGFTTLLRGSGSAKKALQEMAAAEDVARAKGLTLSQGALIVNRALISTGNSARSLGIHFPKAAKQAEKLAIILQRFGGQARANTTEQDKFNAVLFNTETIVGSTLLPVLNKYLASLGNWLTKMDQSGRLQHDVQRAVNDVTGAFRTVGSVIKTVDHVTGSLENTLKDLAAVWLVLKARTALISWGVIAGGIRSTGSAAAAAEGEVSGLSGALLRLKGLGPIAVAIGVTEFVSFARGQAKHIATQNGPNFSLKGSSSQYSLGGRGGVFGGGISQLAPGVAGSPLNPLAPNLFGAGGLGLGALLGTKSAKKAFADAAKAASHGTSLLGQFNLLELKLADAQRASNTVMQRSILVSEEKLLVQLESQSKNLKTRTGFAQQAAGIESQIQALDAAALSKRKKAAKAAAKSALGGVPLDLQLAAAKADALAAGLGLTGLTKAQIAARKAIRTAERKAINSHKLSMQGLIDAWNQIAQVNSELATSTGLHELGFKQLNIDRISKSLGLTGAAAKKLRAELSQVGGGKVPNTGYVGAYGYAVPAGGAHRPLDVHTTISLDGRTIATNTTRHQQQRKTRNPSQRRGPNAGV